MACNILNFLTGLLSLSSALPSTYFPSCIKPSNSHVSQNPVRFEVHLTPGRANPTGAGFRDVILVNGTFTGPTLRLSRGDNVEFLVRNHLREDTAVHFHGITQSLSPWADGTPGIAQRPIRPGAAYLYRWRADESGVFFYHAHSRGQLMDGMYGAIVIERGEDEPSPFHMISHEASDWELMREAEREVQTLMISDWSQFSFGEVMGIEREANIDFTCMDAIVVNGAGSEYCLERELLNEYTNPLVKFILSHTDEKEITEKGCVPPLRLFQGNYSLHLDTLPPEAFRKCIPGVGGGANHTVTVHSSNRWAALTFINPGGLYPLKVTIDNHPMHVFAVDGHYIYPQIVDQILVNNGERYSVFVKLDQEVGRYTIRIANDLLGQVLGGFAALSYNGVIDDPPHPKPLMNYAGGSLVKDIRVFDEFNTRPYPPKAPAPVADRTHKFMVRKLAQPHGAYEWTMSGIEGLNMTTEDVASPFLFQDPSQIETSELMLTTKKNEWVDLIIEVEGPFAQSHPMHKHGNKAFIVGRGVGFFPWATVEEAEKHLPRGTFNFIDPPYKDTFKTLEGVNNNAWLALRYHANSPGAWLFHCHIQTHLAGGMGVVILDGVDEWPELPEAYAEWNGFEAPV
ncbi:multicopper oxidase elcG [Parastagonospora nodorum]|nr:multicopper oxidase elcG [Parastagonospora nodorum]KAH5092082.1 multicopper oxidase elcG [Parastagonospora nodorum]